MTILLEIALYDDVELPESVDAAPAGASGGVLELGAYQVGVVLADPIG